MYSTYCIATATRFYHYTVTFIHNFTSKHTFHSNLSVPIDTQNSLSNFKKNIDIGNRSVVTYFSSNHSFKSSLCSRAQQTNRSHDGKKRTFIRP